MRLREKLNVGLVALGFTLLLVQGCDNEEDPQVTQTVTPQVEHLETDSLMIGESLSFYGQNFLTPSEGSTKLVFDGIFYVEDGQGGVTPEPVTNFVVTPVYDGEYQEGGQLGNQTIRAGTRSLRWNRFGPFSNPFSANGAQAGTFKGEIVAVNTYADGSEEMGEASEVSLTIEPSLVIRKLEPVLGTLADGTLQTAECGAPALRALGGIPYVIEVEVSAFEPEYFLYELTNINGNPGWTSFTHEAAGRVDRLGDPTWSTYLPNNDKGENQEIVVFDPILEDDPYDRRISSIRITAVGPNNEQMFTALPLSVVRPIQFNYDGNRILAERYEPVPVYGPVIGSIGTTLTYAETASESRQNGVSVTVNKSFSQSKGLSNSQNWSEGVSQGTTLSTSNSTGVSHSESENTSESYGVSYNSSTSNSTNVSTSNGTNWGWNSNQGESQEESKTNTEDLYGELSASTTVGVSGEGSVPGFAKVGGKVDTMVGAKAGAKSGEAVGEKTGTTNSFGEHLYESENESTAFGSATTDSKGESVSGSYALGTQSSINSTTSESEATSESVTFQMGGSAGLSENVTEGSSESWSETWVDTQTNTTLLSYSSKIPNGKCAYVFRQTVRYAKAAQLYSYDLCGVRSVLGETVFNEWSWNPNITITEKDQCDAGVPPADMAPAECFFACD